MPPWKSRNPAHPLQRRTIPQPGASWRCSQGSPRQWLRSRFSAGENRSDPSDDSRKDERANAHKHREDHVRGNQFPQDALVECKDSDREHGHKEKTQE